MSSIRSVSVIAISPADDGGSVFAMASAIARVERLRRRPVMHARGAADQRAADQRRREQHAHGGAGQRAPAGRAGRCGRPSPGS